MLQWTQKIHEAQVEVVQNLNKLASAPQVYHDHRRTEDAAVDLFQNTDYGVAEDDMSLVQYHAIRQTIDPSTTPVSDHCRLHLAEDALTALTEKWPVLGYFEERVSAQRPARPPVNRATRAAALHLLQLIYLLGTKVLRDRELIYQRDRQH